MPEATVMNASKTIAVLGNPNTGKTTLFNQLTGLWQNVGNFPGCTVTKKVGQLKLEDLQVQAIDMPGTYSLSASSPDEMVAVDTLFAAEGDASVDVILLVADACTLYRNLYLTSQLMESGLPIVMALNMMDVAEQKGIQIDIDALQNALQIPVIPTCGRRGKGLDELRVALRQAMQDSNTPDRLDLFPEWHHAAATLAASLRSANTQAQKTTTAEVLRAMIDDEGYAEQRLLQRHPDRFQADLKALRNRFVQEEQLIEVETRERYAWARSIFDSAVTLPPEQTESFSDKLDKLLTHKLWGSLILVAVMTLVFQAIFSGAGPLMDTITASVTWVGTMVGNLMPDGMLQSLVVNGIIGGVGGVLIFLPQILMLFLFIAILEDTGYMARAAFLLDKLFCKCGLSGRSLIPMLSSFACAVPGIMSARTIENRRDRLTTILVAPLMSCSARLPVYIILISAFVPNTNIGGWIGLQGLTLFLMYCIGVIVAVPVAWLLKRTILKGETPPFLLELPSYKLPNRKTIFRRVYYSGKEFMVRAGSIILAMSIVVWALAYFPHPDAIHTSFNTQRDSVTQSLQGEELESALTNIVQKEDGAYLRNSMIGRMGQWVEPVVKPLGWDWKIGMAVIASFPAREIIIATLGTIYNLGGDIDEESTELKSAFGNATWPDGRKVFSLAVALSIMVFFALCSQCMATLATIKQETGSWKWAVFTFSYMTVLAYAGAFLTFQAATAVGWGVV